MTPRINLFTIPAGLSFAEELAKGVLARHGRAEDPLALSRVLILLPTRRGIRTLGDAFMRLSGSGSAVLPRMRALGDWDDEIDLLDDDASADFDAVAPSDMPPPISMQRRNLILTSLVKRWAENAAMSGDANAVGAASPALALKLARDLARLLDQAAAEGLAWERLHSLVPVELAEHWSATLKFLEIVTREWPGVLADENASDPVAHRDATLKHAARLWAKTPPPFPVIAAGSTGSVPATAALLKTIAYMPNGQVVLPGLDVETDETTWSAIQTGHPQHGMRELLRKMEATRRDVVAWRDCAADIGEAARLARVRLIAEAMRPAETTTEWRRFIGSDTAAIADGLTGMSFVAARAPAEEALLVSTVLREVAETPAQTAALVTPDRTLARRVAVELKRWGIDIDDSGGTPLSNTQAGRFLTLVAEAAADQLAPVPLLSVLKHPLCALGLSDRAESGAAVEALELKCLRGPRPAAGVAGLRRALPEGDLRLQQLLDRIESGFAPLSGSASEKFALSAIVGAHRDAVERLADDGGPVLRIWDDEAGEAADALLTQLAEAATGVPLTLTIAEYADFIGVVMDEVAVRPRFGRHPRLQIWGPLEARLQRADVMVLSGLNEGVWPQLADPGPWLNRPMRTELELSQPERRVGLSAHDFTQAVSGPRVILTRSEKDGGAPTTASRWLTRLTMLVEGAGLSARLNDERLSSFAGALQIVGAERPVKPPRPAPPLAARPRKLAVTDVERWIRDPYALYARRILKLKPLEPIDATPAAAERGTAIHRALELFTQQFPRDLPDDARAYDALIECGRAAFGEMLERPGVEGFWWPRFERIAKWFVEYERGRRVANLQVFAESQGQLALDVGASPFVLTAIADRIELRGDGEISIADYKTGTAPTEKQVLSNLSPQIPLEAAIALAGGFPGIRATGIADLSIVELKGDAAAGKVTYIKPKDGGFEALAGRARGGLARLVASYDDATMPYLSKPHVMFRAAESDYDHLARFREWSAGGEE